MKKLTGEEILEIISQNYTENNFAYNFFEDLSQDSEVPQDIRDGNSEEILNYLGLGKVEEVEQYGGEGKGDTWYSVKHFVDHDVYIRIDGWYASYNGAEFDEGYGKEVKPQEKVITVYE